MKKVGSIIVFGIFILVLSNKIFLADTSSFTYDEDYLSNSIGESEDQTLVSKIPLPQDYQFIDQSGQLLLYLNQDTASFAIEDKSSDYIWYSTPPELAPDVNEYWKNIISSTIVIKYVDSEKKVSYGTLNDETSSFEIILIDNGFEIDANFLDGKITLGTQIFFQDEELKIKILADSVSDDEDYQLLEVAVAPYFGAVSNNMIPGYYTIPSGVGTLMRFEERTGITATYQASLNNGYAKNYLQFPMFGNIHGVNQHGYMSYIESDLSNVYFEAIPAGYSTSYSTSYFSAQYRQIYYQDIGEGNSIPVITELNAKDYQQSYQFLEDDKANYSGVSVAYRDYLIDKNYLNEKSDYIYRINLNMGFNTSTNGILGTDNVNVTTYNDVTQISNELKQQGLNPRFTFVFTQKKGFANEDYNFDDYGTKMGSSEEKDLLFNTIEKNNQELYLGINLQTTNDNNKGYKKNSDLITNEKDDLYVDEIGDYYLTSKFILNQTPDIIEEINDLGYKNVMINYPQQSVFETTETYEDNIQNITQAFIDSGFEIAVGNNGSENDHLTQAQLSNNTSYNNIPLSSDSSDCFDEVVPITPIILSGSGEVFSQPLNSMIINKKLILNLIEYNIYPNFSLVSTEQNQLSETYLGATLPPINYDYFKDKIILVDQYMSDILSSVAGVKITNNYLVTAGVKVTEYDNGMKIYVNYNEDNITVDGVVLEGQSAQLVKDSYEKD